MAAGIPYDIAARAAPSAARCRPIMTGIAYATSAEMAEELGAFPGYAENAADMLRVIRNHRRAAYGLDAEGYEKLTIPPVPLDAAACPDADLVEAAQRAWDQAIALGEEHGYRNAQSTVIAPTGTIGLVMDCDTTGIEPDFALVKFKKLAGGGYFKIINQAVPEALRTLGYGEAEIEEIKAYAVGHGTLAQAPAINHATLERQGLHRRRRCASSMGRSRRPSTSSSSSTAGRSARSSSPARLRIPGGDAGRSGLRPARASGLLARRTSRRPTSTCAAP